MTALNRRHLASVALLGGSAALLAGCGATGATITADSTSAATLGKVAATVTTDVSTATTLWGIVKGIGQVALATLSVADPAAATIVNTGIGLADDAVTALSSPAVKADATQVAANVTTILAQAQTVLVAAAPAITAVANQA